MTIAKPHCTPFSLLLKDQILLPFLCSRWKDGRGVKWRLNAFNPIRQNPLSTDADEDSIFPSSHSPWRAQQKLCRVGLWAALLLPLKKCMPRAPELRLSHDDLTCPSPLSLLVESIEAFISQKSCITLMPDGTDDTDPTPLTAFDCIDLEARDFPRAASYCSSRIIHPPKLLLNYNMYFTVHMLIFFWTIIKEHIKIYIWITQMQVYVETSQLSYAQKTQTNTLSSLAWN